jgi:hypothetical protein
VLIRGAAPKVYIPTSRFSEAALKGPAPIPEGRLGASIKRPLPEVPSRDKNSIHSRKSSAASGAVSITPSLRSYVDRDTTSPSPSIGFASVKPVGKLDILRPSGHEDSSFYSDQSLNESALPSPLEIPPKRQGISPPSLGSIFSTLTLRRPKRSPSNFLEKLEATPLMGGSKQSTSMTEEDDGTLNVNDNTTASISLSEHEWMRKTPSLENKRPSPSRGSSQSGSFEEVHRPAKKKDSPGRMTSLRKKAMDWYDDVKKANTAPEQCMDIHESDGAVALSGNWI